MQYAAQCHHTRHHTLFTRSTPLNVMINSSILLSVKEEVKMTKSQYVSGIVGNIYKVC